MRYLIQSFCIILLLAACDPYRIYDRNLDFQEGQWSVNEQPEFEFQIDDTNVQYNLYANVRNSISYPKSNLYFSYQLRDSIGTVIHQDLITEQLFDFKTGKPFGSSVLGDIYSHRFLVMENFTFSHPGKYTIRFEQFIREEILPGVLSIGLRVEKSH